MEDVENRESEAAYENEEPKQAMAIQMQWLLAALITVGLVIVSVPTYFISQSGSDTIRTTVTDTAQRNTDSVVKRLVVESSSTISSSIHDFTMTPFIVLLNTKEMINHIKWEPTNSYNTDVLRALKSIATAYQQHSNLDGTVSAYITSIPADSSERPMHLAAMGTPHGWFLGPETFVWGESTQESGYDLLMHPRNTSSLSDWRSTKPVLMRKNWDVRQEPWYKAAMDRPSEKLQDPLWGPAYYQPCISKLVKPLVMPIPANGQDVGYLLVLDIELEYFSRYLRGHAKYVSQNTKVALIEASTGNEIAHSLSRYDSCIRTLQSAVSSPDPTISGVVSHIASSVGWDFQTLEITTNVSCGRGCRAEYAPEKRDCNINYVGDGDGDGGDTGDTNTGDGDGDGDADADADGDGDADTGDGDADGNAGVGDTGDADADGNTGDGDADTDAGGDADGDAGDDTGDGSPSAIIGPLIESVIVHAVGISDQFGLRWVTVIIIPRDDFYAEIDEAQRDADETADRVQVIVLSVTLGTFIVTLIACISFVKHIANEQTTFSRLLEEAATIQNLEQIAEANGTTDSFIAEISAMRISLNTLIYCLIEYRSFLPANLHCEIDDSDTDSDTRTELALDDTVSISSMGTSRRDVVPVVGNRGKTALCIQPKLASIVTLSVYNFLRGVNGDSESDLAKGSLIYMSMIKQCIGKGVIERFNGDKVVVSFNASTPCRSGAEQACAVSRMIISEYSKIRNTAPLFGGRLGIGVSSGIALCGNLGCDTTRSFNIVGQVVVDSQKCSELAAAHSKPDASAFFQGSGNKRLPGTILILVGFIGQTTRKPTRCPSTVGPVSRMKSLRSNSTIVQTKSNRVYEIFERKACQEWMYELNEAEDYIIWNGFLDDYFEGHFPFESLRNQLQESRVRDDTDNTRVPALLDALESEEEFRKVLFFEDSHQKVSETVSVKRIGSSFSSVRFGSSMNSPNVPQFLKENTETMVTPTLRIEDSSKVQFTFGSTTEQAQ
eukprot:TRINITY_DN19304_c0_g1_i1.p1 TRINITY_DN19304_c0_g1~~TRINITY_DN19304_c0_g1_i1.p1  ORF type:complete len:1007 (+),score=162.37 TRINITY_DN19304_c0_g1_i1:41-3061(+)